jgi:4-amino-4-deoxy-L-arabinose transferase-like glycosyltransferase
MAGGSVIRAVAGGNIHIVILLAVGLAFRLWQIDLTHFDLDQATILSNVETFVRSGQPPLESGSTFSTGFRIPPLITYILAVPAVISRDPVWISAAQASLDALGILVLYLAGLTLAGRRAAICAAAAYVVSPAVITHARVVWNPSLIPLFSAIGLWGTLEVARNGRARGVIAAVTGVGAAALLHPTALGLAPAVVAALARARHRADWRGFVVGVAGLIILALPYLVLQVQSGGADLRAAVGDLGAAPREFSPRAVDAAILLSAGDFADLGTRGGIPLRWPPEISAANGVWLALVGAGMVMSAVLPGGWIVLLWFLLPVITTVRSVSPLPPHYVIALVPAAALLAGVAISALPGRLWLMLLVGLVIWRGGSALEYWTAVERGAYVNTAGVPLRYSMGAARRLSDLSPGTIFVGDRHTHGGIYRYLSDNRLDPLTFSADQGLALDSDGLYLIESGSRAESALRQLAMMEPEEIRAVDGRPLYALFRVTADRIGTYLDTFRPLDGEIGGFLDLRGYRMAEGAAAGGRSEVEVAWRITDPDQRNWDGLRVFAFLTDGKGRPRSSRFDEFVANTSRISGLAVVQWMDLTIPEDAATGGYWLNLGFYRLGTPQPLSLYRGADRVDGNLRLGPFRLKGRQPESQGQPWATFADEAIALQDAAISDDRVVLAWRAIAPVSEDYTVFVHLLDQAGQIVGQHDAPPQSGAFPTSLWRSGDVLEDAHPVGPISDAVVAVEIGLYEGVSGRRLEATEPGGRTGDHVVIPLSTRQPTVGG